jgi:hypothetical protein
MWVTDIGNYYTNFLNDEKKRGPLQTGDKKLVSKFVTNTIFVVQFLVTIFLGHRK